ncbi:hypothetical protein LTR08_008409 [Meristemomyces frigidus]|nr:hypothetical protein LTR08_008409 [Meristemomyces frigidus]
MESPNSNNPWARGQSPTGSERRRLSFHPTSEWTPPKLHTPENEAEDEARATHAATPKRTRILQVALAILSCLLAAGPVFGFAALKPVLAASGVYRGRCPAQELLSHNSNTNNDHGALREVCYEQELRLNLMFTVAAVSTNVCALPVGAVLDRYGPRVASLIGVVFLALGAVSMAFAAQLPFDAYIPGYLFLAIGGPFVFIPSFQLSNTFPRHSGLILALLTGAFDSSSAVFLAYRLIWQQTDGDFTIKKFFLAYLVVPALILVAQLFIMPSQSYKTSSEPPAKLAEDSAAIAAPATRDSDSEATTLLAKPTPHQTNAINGALHSLTARQQILTPWFLLITLFTILQMTRINYFVATLHTQYTHLLHSAPAATRINNFFDVALPLGGVLSVPFIGLVLDHTSTPFVLALLVTLATAIGVLGIIPSPWAAYSNISLFVLYRPFYYTAVSDYSAKVFGYATFGTVYGLIICLAGLGNFSQAGLDALTHGAFGDDPVPVNVLLLVAAAAVGVALVGFVGRQSWVMGRGRLEVDAEEAPEVLMPGAPREEVERVHGHRGYGSE